MRIMVLGTGLQGRAALYDLARSPEVTGAIAADSHLEGLRPFLERLEAAGTIPAGKIELAQVNAEDEEQVARLLRAVDCVIDLLPTPFHTQITRLAIENGAHLVNASYVTPAMRQLGQRAAEEGLAVLPEFGFDPGIDLVLAGQAVQELDEVQVYLSYGAGFPEPGAGDNPLRYKISWSFAGVLQAYTRQGRVVREGQVVEVPGNEIFAPANTHVLEVEQWGPLEAYPNGDVVPYLDELGIRESVRSAGRFSLRYPGHCAFWHALAQLGFLDDKPVEVQGAQVVPRAFLQSLLEPQLQYTGDERDVALLRVEVSGRKGGQPRHLVYQVSDLRDRQSGLLAMNRLVGFTASIGAQMILSGAISKRGLVSPLCAVPAGRFLKELAMRGIQVQRRELL